MVPHLGSPKAQERITQDASSAEKKSGGEESRDSCRSIRSEGFRTAVGRLVALGTVFTFLTFQYIASQTRSAFGFYEAFFQFSSCIIIFNFLLIINRWTEYEPIPGIKDDRRLPTINVIIPAYNESAFVKNSISSVVSSDYPKGKIHIIVVDDGSSDDTWSHAQHATQEAFRLEPLIRCTAVQHEINRGKRQAMATALAAATNEVVVTLDSDTVLEKQALRNLVSPLVLESNVGGVAGHLSVFNVNAEGWQSFIPRTLDCLFEQNGNIPRAAQSKHGFITILPGAISAVRRQAYQLHAQELVDARFLGKPLRHGEDVQLTMNLLSDGWRLRYQSNAVVYTVAPETLRKAFLMYVRWERSNYTYWILGLVKLAFTDAKRLVLNRLGLLSLSQADTPLDLEKQDGKRVANARQPDFAPMLTIICATCATLSCVEAAFSWVWWAFRSPWVTTMNVCCLVVFATWSSPLLLADALSGNEDDAIPQGGLERPTSDQIGSFYPRLRKKMQYFYFSTVANFFFPSESAVESYFMLQPPRNYNAVNEKSYTASIRVKTRAGTVAFTFSDGPSFYTNYILHEFAQLNATATFFLDTLLWLMEENHSSYWESMVRRMVEDGHLIGLATKSCNGGSDNHNEIEHALAEARKRRLTLNGQRLVFPAIGSADLHDNPKRDFNSTFASLLNDLESADPEKDALLIQLYDTEHTALSVRGLLHSRPKAANQTQTLGQD
ncbi:nucleotide-diphospho-sugar transferase [Colletotrichum cereale]|nr:nucleotide-diphospho-sugar transferase [Colletotrichum cereale]